MGHVAIFCNDLETLHSLDIADYVLQVDWSVLLNPAMS